MRRLLMLSAILTGLAAPGCMLNPLHGEWIDAYDEPIEVSGYTIAAGRAMTIQCTPWPHYSSGTPGSGVWVEFAEVVSSNETIFQGGQTMYRYETDVVVPEECWLDQDNYTPRKVTWVRVIDDISGAAVESWTPAGYECLVTRYFGGDSPSEAADYCHDIIGHPQLQHAAILAPL